MVQFKSCPFLNFIGPSATFISLKFYMLTICFIDEKLRKSPEWTVRLYCLGRGKSTLPQHCLEYFFLNWELGLYNFLGNCCVIQRPCLEERKICPNVTSKPGLILLQIMNKYVISSRMASGFCLYSPTPTTDTADLFSALLVLSLWPFSFI